MFSLKDLIDSYEKKIISYSMFQIKLYEYIKSIYDEAYKNPDIMNIIASSNFKIDLDSILERVCIACFDSPDDFYLANDKNNEFNEIDAINENSYEIFHCRELKALLGSIPKKQNKKVNISIGLETGTVFVNIVGKKKDRMNNDEPVVATYALPDKSLVVQIEKRGKNYSFYDCCENSAFNSVVCSRFDPSHIETINSSGYRNTHESQHINKYDKVEILPQEKLDLYKKYFRDVAPCPHFHFYLKDICYTFGNNKESFAININDLNRYLNDLESAYNNKKKNDPILKYDLGMPYLDIMQGTIICDMSDFITKAKEIFKKYSGRNKVEGISKLYDLIETTRRNDYARALCLASDVLCFVNSTIQEQSLSQESYLSSMTTLGNSFANATSNAISAKNILKNKEEDNEPNND